MYNEDGTAINPEKTSEHDLIVDPGSIVTGYCNSTPISLGVANEAGSGGLSVGDHFPGEQVRYHIQKTIETQILVKELKF